MTVIATSEATKQSGAMTTTLDRFAARAVTEAAPFAGKDT